MSQFVDYDNFRLVRQAELAAYASHIAACDGALWLVGNGGCWAVTPRGKKKDRDLVLR